MSGRRLVQSHSVLSVAPDSFSVHVWRGLIVVSFMHAFAAAYLQLLNEIKIHKSLDHANIVRFERFFEDKNNVYILLEVCPSQARRRPRIVI